MHSYSVNCTKQSCVSGPTNGLLPTANITPSVTAGVARVNVDGNPVMGGIMVPGSGGESQAVGYDISSMNGGMNARCSAFPLWYSTNHPYNIGGQRVSTNWIPLSSTSVGL